MSSQSTNDDMEQKYNFLIRALRDVALPVIILALIAYYFAFKTDQRLIAIEYNIQTHQKLLQRICINTADDWYKQSQCWAVY